MLNNNNNLENNTNFNQSNNHTILPNFNPSNSMVGMSLNFTEFGNITPIRE